MSLLVEIPKVTFVIRDLHKLFCFFKTSNVSRFDLFEDARLLHTEMRLIVYGYKFRPAAAG
jgi:hypothetical protein